jgi:hypothetical protein
MTRNMPKKIRVRIFVEERNDGMVWVPYKTLIGHTIKGRSIISRQGEQVHCFEEFETKTEAVEAAKRRAWIRLMELFGDVDEVETAWEVVHERGPELVVDTDAKAFQAIGAEAVATAAA